MAKGQLMPIILLIRNPLYKSNSIRRTIANASCHASNFINLSSNSILSNIVAIYPRLNKTLEAVNRLPIPHQSLLRTPKFVRLRWAVVPRKFCENCWLRWPGAAQFSCSFKSSVILGGIETLRRTD
jgi:hypothetical protein